MPGVTGTADASSLWGAAKPSCDGCCGWNMEAVTAADGRAGSTAVAAVGVLEEAGVASVTGVARGVSDADEGMSVNASPHPTAPVMRTAQAVTTFFTI